MLTEKDYCDYDTCVALKELGYVGSSRYYYTQRDHKFHYDAYNKFYTVRTADAMGYVLAIHLYEAQKWLREIHNIFVMIDRSFAARNSWHYVICANDDFEHLIEQPSLENYSYEEALSEGLRTSIKILRDE